MTQEQQEKIIETVYLMKSVADSDVKTGKENALSAMVDYMIEILEWKAKS